MTTTSNTDTIVAIATPMGRGGIGVVRVSGAAVLQIARQMAGSLPAPRQARLVSFNDAAGNAIDRGLLLYFPAPHSYSGEDMLELHAHGSPAVLALLLERLLQLGARRAEPGEFTQRAYLNDKLDLAQAEAVADLIDASSAAAARAALRSLQGEFSTAVHELAEALTQLRVYVEAAIDFPEEEVDFLADTALRARLTGVQERCASLLGRAQQGRLLNDGLSVVIAGAPNAGKSTLLNRLAGYDAAIVTEIPGTTRDLLRERIDLDGLPLHIVDTAGLRDTGDPIEREGIRRAEGEMSRADHVLFVIDAPADPTAAAYREQAARLPPGVPVTLLYNKIDQPWRRTEPVATSAAALARIEVSAQTGEGMDALRAHLKASAGYSASEGGALSARARHVEALIRARGLIDRAADQLQQHRAGELVAEELKRAQAALGEITGAVGSDELLGQIFSSFCIGK